LRGKCFAKDLKFEYDIEKVGKRNKSKAKERVRRFILLVIITYYYHNHYYYLLLLLVLSYVIVDYRWILSMD